MGLLGMAFHPNFPTDPRVFLSYTNQDAGLVSRISSFRTLDNGATLDPGTEQILLTLNQPEANHNGGNIAFGPDGLLYIGFGDGGGGGDNHGAIGNGQRLTTMLGKVLRIDVGAASATSYTVPDGNPFFNGTDRCPAAGRASGNCPEIFAWGFRNPWRWSFDRLNGDLWVADVGQGMWEEVDQVTVENNYGWRCREGAHDFNLSGCTGGGLTDPVAEYDHSLGVSITGGYVYRGTQATNLTGRFLFGDFGSGRIWAWIPESAAQPRAPTQLLDTDLSIASFGQANDGELYIVNYGGTLHHIEFQAGPVTAPCRAISARRVASSPAMRSSPRRA
jgi:glucose/arabinose dehydrogenase